ncbi:hypothetical protein J2S00_004066, partial [Caldalkalibacillus uzonensis]|nr:hypothetical protein [Caldalkalibacillus uzonensis]
KNGFLRIYYGQHLIAEHVKATGKHQVLKNKKHFEGMRTAGTHKVPQPTPRLAMHSTPEVAERDVSFYDQFSEGEVQ